MLNSVTALSINAINTSTAIVSWKPPFTLQDVPLEYIIEITTTSEAENTNTYLPLEYMQPGINYTIAVKPKNLAGIGTETTIIYLNQIGGMQKL